MVDDIVTRLRSATTQREWWPRDRLDAADEIERLRAALRDIALFSPYKHSSTLRRKARAALAGEAFDDAAT